jgi:hypothetical protein
MITTIIPGTAATAQAPAVLPTNTVTTRPRPILSIPTKPDAADTQKAFSRFVYEMSEVEKWDKAKAALQAAIINSNTAAGIASLSCKGLVLWVEAKSSITTDEIEIVDQTLSTPLAHFSEFEDRVVNTNMNYTFLSKHNHVLPPLMQIKLFTQSLSRFDQFTTYIATYKDTTPMAARTYEGLSAFLIKHYSNMPKESTSRGGHAFGTKYKGKKGKKGKNKGGDKGKGKSKSSEEPARNRRMSYEVKRKRERSRSLSPAMSLSTVHNPALADHQAYVAQQTHSDTRSQRSHKSSASSLHSWAQPSATTSSPCGPNERDVNPDPNVYHYCYSHGFNTTHKSETCAKL